MTFSLKVEFTFNGTVTSAFIRNFTVGYEDIKPKLPPGISTTSPIVLEDIHLDNPVGVFLNMDAHPGANVSLKVQMKYKNSAYKDMNAGPIIAHESGGKIVIDEKLPFPSFS